MLARFLVFVVIQQAYFFVAVCALAWLSPPPSRQSAILGSNLTLSCGATGDPPLHFLWTKDGQPVTQGDLGLAHSAQLTIQPVTRKDAGKYVCLVRNRHERRSASTYVIVLGRPDPPTNVEVRPSTVVASISWYWSGEDPINNWTLVYRPLELSPGPWRPQVAPAHLGPKTRHVDLFHLRANTTYELKVWANNQIGAGQAKHVLFTTHAPTDPLGVAVGQLLSDRAEDPWMAWVLAVAIVMATLVLLVTASAALLYQDWKAQRRAQAGPYYDNDERVQLLGPTRAIVTDENFNSEERGIRFQNNNSVMHPCRV